ncbi:hypothetical protein DFO66_101240 [Brevibacterium sanguinis]|uniref:Uncharacterized protein n=2 Tax=Brevibacterium TaxID=1696 RepID=A0A366IR19_9MICO|nr:MULTISPECIES: MarR family winged helix-turn-helix transcriptional regulator [Brevibacterium]RBP68016.1 hypothetical protein DFO66_101240 [Brevibacterium sanguinis]RBP74567.1 hypothetical protein DFO65_101289 [Brevibacterium celere]
MVSQRTLTIRTLSARLNSFHSLAYFSDAVAEACARAGVESRAAANIASRSAPLGPVGAGVVSAAFCNYSPAYIASIVPAVWESASPEALIGARFVGVSEHLRSLFGDRDDIALLTEAAGELSAALGEVVAGMDFSGRPLAAATAEALAGHDPGTAFERLWDLATVAREYRGDGHVASLVVAGIPGIEALLLDVATGASFRPRAAQRTRGHTDEEWHSAQDRLEAAGLITVGTDDRGHGLPTITEAGKELREQVEELTDATVRQAWEGLDDEQIESLLQPSRALIKVLGQSGVFPAGVFSPRRSG